MVNDIHFLFQLKFKQNNLILYIEKVKELNHTIEYLK